MWPRRGSRGRKDQWVWTLQGPAWLQCGHGGEAVEDDGIDGRSVLEKAWLQCGHGGEAVEEKINGCGRSKARLGFNVATAVKPWKTTGSTDGPFWKRLGFNVATAGKPWKKRSMGVDAPRPGLASMWPRR